MYRYVYVIAQAGVKFGIISQVVVRTAVLTMSGI